MVGCLRREEIKVINISSYLGVAAVLRLVYSTNSPCFVRFLAIIPCS